MPWTEEDTQAMDAAAGQAAKELPALKTADQVYAWFAQWYAKAGHKRLGRLLVQRATISPSEAQDIATKSLLTAERKRKNAAKRGD